ncbi:MAG: hypothetical protein ACE362_01875 [Phaeodactylibacter xiamenensis]|nr:hypothetical protein [Phaeodactylibacter xiamenensis]MCR9054750.1 hypothetical protein [bacterium]
MKLLPLFMILMGVLLFAACEKDCLDPANPECANYDPCLAYEPANASFKMLIIPISTYDWDCDGGEPRDLEFEVDTVFATGGDIYFRADQTELQASNVSYEWRVGADPQVWTTRQFNLGFLENAVGDVPVTLIVEKINPDLCGGTAYTRDTVTKILHVREPLDNTYTDGSWSAVFGKWEGYNTDDESRTFQIEFKPGWRLEGLFDGCIVESPDLSIGLKQFYIAALGKPDCNRVCGVGALSPDRRELSMDYSYDGANGERVSRTFKGVKVE